MAIKYGDFSFDSKHGFTGSCGKKAVKGYMRGGPVRKARGGPPDEYEASEPKGKTIEDIIEETKGIEVKAEPRRKSTIPEMTPDEMRRVKATADAEKRKRQYDEETENMRENPMNKAKGGFAKMAGEPNRGVQDQTIANLQRQKTNYAKGGSARTGKVAIGRAVKMGPPPMPAAMAVPRQAPPKAPPSLGRIAMSANPAMMMKKGGQSKVQKVMHEFKAGELHSGSKKGPMVKSRKQAIAIALSEARKGKK
jgi:hypothetical protein